MTHPLLSLAAFAARVLPMPVKRFIYRLGPLANAVRVGLNRAAQHGLTEVTVAGGGLAGLRLQLDMQKEKDYWLGTYEPDLQAALRELAQPGMTAYDVGAHIGYISLLLARAVRPSGRVFAFEPLPANLDRLRANLALNPQIANVTVIPAAASDRTGATRFLLHASGEMGKAEGSAGRQAAYSGAVDVAAIALDDFVYAQGHPAPGLLKLDIEGGEVLALPGMRRLLAEARPVVLLELHGPESAAAAWAAFIAAGYSLHRMAAGLPRVTALDELDWKAYVVARP
ncbi:MAG: FkbM family methyltransferase [Anaerolineae bacterium]|nr:MAG: FkbM family methyltransferase [Anaerolineae bacterium]